MSGMSRRQLMEEFGDPGDDGTSRASMRHQREQQEAAAQREMEDERHSQLATPGDAHREWHLNSGVPMGTSGCPQDACHLPDDPTDEGWPAAVDSLWPGAVKCGNWRQSPWGEHYHGSVADVRECYAMAGRFTVDAQTERVLTSVGLSAPSPEQVRAMGFPRGFTGDPVEPPAPAPADFLSARWSSIPVGAKGFGYYAIEDQEKVRFFRVERPTEGKWQGKTFIKEQASDTFYPVEPKQRGYTYLTEIASDPETAGRLYAETLSKCTRCGRTLTDEESRERSMGPDCFKSGGW